MGRTPSLEISTAPFLRAGLSTNRIMVEVLLALVPVVGVACMYFGVTTLLVIAAATLGAVGMEWVGQTDRRGLGSLGDCSAVLTGILLGLSLPPAIPLWMAFLGGVVAIGLGKSIWGGLGRNLFNPALVGRAFLQTAFPVAATTWSEPGEGLFSFYSGTFAPPLMRPFVDGVSAATPLGLHKFEQTTTSLWPLLVGRTTGSLGETCGLLLILCGVVLVVRGVVDWRLMVSTLLAVALASGVLHLVNPATYPGPLFMIASGGLLFATVFMVTDPVTTPLAPQGAWIFGIGVGLLVVLIRLFGGLPEGVMLAILLMNAATPHINRYCQPRHFGG